MSKQIIKQLTRGINEGDYNAFVDACQLEIDTLLSHDEKSEIQKKKQLFIDKWAVAIYLDRVKKRAESSGITHQQIADVTGFKRSNISRVLDGRYKPRLDVVLKIAAACGIYLRIESEINKEKQVMRSLRDLPNLQILNLTLRELIIQGHVDQELTEGYNEEEAEAINEKIKNINLSRLDKIRISDTGVDEINTYLLHQLQLMVIEKLSLREGVWIEFDYRRKNT